MENINSNDEIVNLELGKIYSSWCYFNEAYFNTENSTDFVNKIIDENFDENIKLIEETKLIEDDNLINKLIILLFKLSVTKYNCKKTHLVFIGFCDYFNLDSHIVYNKLHSNLQIIIKVNTQKFVGKNIFNKLQLKSNNGIRIRTLKDII